MKERELVPILMGEMEKHILVLERLETFYRAFRDRHTDLKSMDTEASMALAKFFCNYYTCVETIFFRISSFFENNLDKKRWHAHLLERMALTIPDQRPAVISDETTAILQDFLRFRHFTRYYFDFNYDPVKLEFLGNRFEKSHSELRKELDVFKAFLTSLESGA